MAAFLDTNVLIALLNPAEPHHDWCVEEVMKCKSAGPALISDIVFCEFTMGMKSLDEANIAVADLGIERRRVTDTALYRAGIAFKEYKKNGGPKAGVLPDFIIGAEASAHKVPLVTANAKDYINYFPEIEVIGP